MELFMQFLVNILAGVATSAVFWLITTQFTSLGTGAQIVGMIVVFVISAGLGFWWSEKSAEKGASIGSRSIFEKGLDATVEKTTIDSPGSKELFTGNTVKGDTKISIRDAKIKG
jgi:hypothetical protein